MNDMQKAFLREMKKAKRRGGGFTEVSVTSSHFALQVHSIAFVSALLSHIVTFSYRILCVFLCMRYLCLRAFISVPLCVLVVAILWPWKWNFYLPQHVRVPRETLNAWISRILRVAFFNACCIIFMFSHTHAFSSINLSVLQRNWVSL